MASGKLVSRKRIGDVGFTGVGLIEKGRVLAAITNRHVYLWQLHPWRLLARVPTPAGTADGAAAVTPDGRVAAVGTRKGGIVFVDLRTGKQTVGAAGHVGDVQNDAVSPDGRLFVTVGDDAKVIVWDTHTYAPLEILTGHGGRITGLAFSADSKTLYTCSLDGSILEWDLGNARRFGRPFSFRDGELGSDPGAPSTPALAVAPDASRLALLAAGRKVDVVRLSDLRTERTFGSHVTALAWSPDGSLVAAGGDDGRLQLWNVRTGRLVRSLAGFHGLRNGAEAVQAVAFDRTGRRVAAVDGDFFPGPRAPYGHLAVWSAATGRTVVPPERRASFGYSVGFSPDDRTLVSGFAGGDAYVVGLPSGRLLRTIKPRGGDVVSVAFSRTGTLATGTWAGIVQLWNPGTGAPLGHPVLAQPSPIASLAFDPRGDTFATTGGSDGTAKLWATATQQQLGSTFQSDPSQWGTARFTADGTHLIVIYGDGTGYVWPTTVGAWVTHACAVAGRNLTREEWARYVPHRNYARVCS
jgi:WD40 repeat protein